MPFSFPGMNPYLERPDLWIEVHAWLIVELARTLNSVLQPKYRAAVEQRVYTDLLLVGIPDVSVAYTKPAKQPEKVSTTTLNQPIKVTLPMPEEVRETYLEIRQIDTGRVVTVIEVLSPKNKRAGEGRNQYNAKRLKVLESLSHLVKIDLLRAETPLPMSGQVQSDYRILVSRAQNHPEAELYAFGLREPIPLFPLPLQAGDEEPIINLNLILQDVYIAAALDLVIDYTQQPKPALEEDDFRWMKTLLPGQV
ncbi:MAG: DUF4058 family protein [Leptolyngbyaceae cyanobacterium SM2_5_2]|nr:DUF4058 family protein [Leptolyngbyaceae cyanobacterium SM2_5_2]